MRRVVNEPGGTRRAAHLKEIVVAGKTGTAEHYKKPSDAGSVVMRPSRPRRWLSRWQSREAVMEEPLQHRSRGSFWSIFSGIGSPHPKKKLFPMR
ncbi:MAG: hypothetical protein IPI28_00295 [Candidatus Omnitrophica bacterium]|nr:hypothetical protein [Candidatus Omnitrophota bacterium]